MANRVETEVLRNQYVVGYRKTFMRDRSPTPVSIVTRSSADRPFHREDDQRCIRGKRLNLELRRLRTCSWSGHGAVPNAPVLQFEFDARSRLII